VPGPRYSGGEGGIRTHGGLTPTTVFETVGSHIILCHLIPNSAFLCGIPRFDMLSSTILYRLMLCSSWAKCEQKSVFESVRIITYGIRSQTSVDPVHRPLNVLVDDVDSWLSKQVDLCTGRQPAMPERPDSW